jgi:rhodanese-related sulfurtransferase
MKWFDVKRMKTTVGAILRELPRIAAIATGALVLAIAGNTMHPMNLPLLVTKGQPGVPNWVFERLKQVDTQGAMGLVNDPEVLVIDTRDEPDFRKQHIPGAVSLPYHEFNQRYPHFAESVSKARPLLLYCYGTGCGLAARVGKRLITRGYTDVTILRGGIEAWKAGNLPLETPEERNEN